MYYCFREYCSKAVDRAAATYLQGWEELLAEAGEKVEVFVVDLRVQGYLCVD